MPPATTMSALPAREKIVREHRRLHARAAHLVDGRGADAERHARAERGLPRRRLALAGGQHAAHHDLVDGVGRQAGALQRGAAIARGAERGRGDVLEIAEKAAHRRARRADDRRSASGLVMLGSLSHRET